MNKGVVDVFSPRHPFEIRQSIIHLVAINMINIHITVISIIECVRDKSVNIIMFIFNPNSHIPIWFIQ